MQVQESIGFEGANFGLMSSPLQVLLESPAKSTGETGIPAKPTNFCSPLIGRVTGIDASGMPLLDFVGNPESGPLPARHVCPIGLADVGREAVLLFEKNDPHNPIVLGLLEQMPDAPQQSSESQPVTVSLDGEQLNLTAKNEIVLRCGKASITLTRAGKVIIRGAYLLSRSSGVNRIKGGSVQIN